jgi:hypothetical protein
MPPNKDPKTELKKTAVPTKAYYDVKVEAMIPATLTYRVLAETPEQAAELIRGASPIAVKHRLVGKRDIKLAVYDAGCSFIKFLRNL